MTNFKTNKIIRLLNKYDWYEYRQKGSHVIVKKVQKLLGLTKKKLEEEIKKI
jgi:predicted RNA binding protein YcfA (HicA-like mRNA interferase family)